jgi:protein phosphatase
VGLLVAVGSCTSPGRVRPANQDAAGYFSAPDGGRDKGRLFVLADGMGGEAGGEVASGLAVEVIARAYFEHASPDPAVALAHSVRLANQAILEQASASAALRGMGTTCTALVLRGATACVAHVGDSRAYHVRDGAVRQLTTDHSLAHRGPAYAHVLTRALGVQPAVEVDVVAVSPPPRAGDVFLLCSDGLWGQVDEADIAEVLAAEPDLDAASRRLVDLANARGGPDNVTVLLVRIERAEEASWARALPGTLGRLWRRRGPAGRPG